MNSLGNVEYYFYNNYKDIYIEQAHAFYPFFLQYPFHWM